MLLRKIPNHITGYQHPPSFTKFTSVTKKKEISTRFKNNLTVTRPRDGAAPSIPFLLFLKRFFTQPIITIKVIMQILVPQWWNFEKTWTCVDQVVGMALPLFGIGAQDRNSPSGFRVWGLGLGIGWGYLVQILPVNSNRKNMEPLWPLLPAQEQGRGLYRLNPKIGFNIKLYITDE